MIEAGEIPRIEAALDVLLGELVAIDMTPRAPAPKDGLVDDRVRTAILRRDHTFAVSKKDGQLTSRAARLTGRWRERHRVQTNLPSRRASVLSLKFDVDAASLPSLVSVMVAEARGVVARETENIDMDKIVAAILTAGRLATVGGQTPKDYIQEYQNFLRILKSPANIDDDEYASGVSDTLAKGRKC